MLGSCEKMVVIPSTTNEWPQNQVNEKGLIMASSSSSPSSATAAAAAKATTRVMMMEKLPISQQDQQQQQQQQQVPLKCPRCDSSNTKFCYYNNYSLSQPRHFCKACKRYWTRGGTLRNVPVGGGCRKNKRVKRPTPTPTSTSTSSLADVVTTTTSSLNHHYSGGGGGAGGCHIDLSQSPPPPPHINPLFYSLLTNPSDLNLPYPTFNSRVSNLDSFDLHMNGNLGLGFSSSSSGLLVSDLQNGGFPSSSSSSSLVKQNQSHNNSFLNSQSYPVFGSTPTSTSTTATMASLIATTLHQQKLMNSLGGNNNFVQGCNDDDNNNNGEGCVGANKDVKMEDNINGGQNRFDWNNMVNASHNHIEQQMMINSNGDAPLLWNATSGVGVGAWLDPSNMGSSVPSLI